MIKVVDSSDTIAIETDAEFSSENVDKVLAIIDKIYAKHQENYIYCEAVNAANEDEETEEE